MQCSTDQRSRPFALVILLAMFVLGGWPAGAAEMTERLGVPCQVASWYIDDPIIDGPDPVGMTCPSEGPQFTHDITAGGHQRTRYCPSYDAMCQACRQRAETTSCEDCDYLVYYYMDPFRVVHCVWAKFEIVKRLP